MPELIEPSEVEKLLKRIPEWDHEGEEISRLFEFDDFSQGVDFLNGVADIAEESEHHPEMTINYHNVIVRLTTHDAGGLTDADFDLAEKIDTLSD